ncbi:DUF5066 family protein [Klebsiella sp. RHBSTW-00465]|uniref:DUF5066 family protein n=1 Tax=Klebsiella sp. RHBSTW-00465 TaxID=2742650 RepID=UPI0015F43B1C|nr:DUF5066 family protein [Klebsiella sp. RHBSTW-00465]MBA7848401.1 DUF5066 family protein [Klebsiella sp. RHBSTW-00465]
MEYSLKDLMELVEKNNRNKSPNPMPEDEISQLRVRKYRNPQNEDTVELPESLKALLAYDRQLISPHSQPVIESLQMEIDDDGVLHSDYIDEDIYYRLGMDESGKSIEECSPIWNNDPCLPALIRIDHIGDQGVFIYITERDENGEYPIVRQDDHELWLVESSLIEYLHGIFSNERKTQPEWEVRKKANEIRDGALLELEYIHHDLFDKLEDFAD